MNRGKQNRGGGTPENLLPYPVEEAGEQKGGQVRRMFDMIAPGYDKMNMLMTFGLCRLWRESALRSIRSRLEGAEVLDVATGTGDLAFRLAEKYGARSVTGIDLSEGMLAEAQRRLSRSGDSGKKIRFLQADCLELPFANGSFDAVTVAYGVRNFENLARGYREMLRVLRPGGTLLVIELAEPRNPLLRRGYGLHTRFIVPALGKCVTGDPQAYTYLPRSIAACPDREQMERMIADAGFTDTSWRSLPPGTVVSYQARKPLSDSIS